MRGITAFYRKGITFVRESEELSRSFLLGVEVRQRCVMSPWLFDIFMDECMRGIQPR